MSHARRKRLLLGALAAVAPVPLPLNGVTSWLVLGLYWAVLALYFHRVWRGSESWLSGWTMNLLALAYLPFLLGDLTWFWRGQVLQPLAHLTMFTLAVKLFALKREADKWHAVLAIFFLFLAAMGSSVHPAVMAYQAVMLALALLTLTLFAGYHEEARETAPAERAAAPAVPIKGFVAIGVLTVLVGTVPLFLLLPRLRQPYLVGPGVGGGGGQMTGFSDQVTLDSIGRVRTSSAVAFRFAFEGPSPVRGAFRFKAGVYDRFVGEAWRRGARRSRAQRVGQDGFFHVAPGLARGWATIWVKQMAGARLVVPVETVMLDLPRRALVVDDGGGVALMRPASGTFTYRAGLETTPAVAWPASGFEGPTEVDLDTSQVTPRIAELAAEVMGADGDVTARATRLELHLIRNYAYSLELPAGREPRPIERFLFETRQGHCEYFATAMVLMLRSQGIPARFVTGYYGAEFNPLQEYFIVRQSNAHAWVDVYIDGVGWQAFDPTPAAGLPGDAATNWRSLAVQAYDYLLFRWDRYVLTYGFNDQAGFLLGLRDLWRGLWDRFGSDAPEEAGDLRAARESDPAPAEGASPAVPTLERWRWAPMLLAVVALLAWLWLRRRRADAVDAYRALRGELTRRRYAVLPSTPPLAVERQIRDRCPEAAGAAGRIVRLYLRESFAGRPVVEEERRLLRSSLREVRRQLRRPA